MARCEDCGTTLRGGICPNCQEELYIYENQMEPEDMRKMSKEFADKVEQQAQSPVKPMTKEDYVPTREQRKAKELIEHFERALGVDRSNAVVAAEICVGEILATFAVLPYDQACIYWNKVNDEIQTY